MSRILFVVWALVIAQVAFWAFAPEPKPNSVNATQQAVQSIDADGTEKYHVEGRVSQRKDAIAALELPFGSRCTGEGRQRFIGGIGEYYYQRQNQMERYPEIFGKAGADYIAGQWSTPDDRRIDRLTQEAYAWGYLAPSDFNGVAGKMVAAVVKGERVIGHACAG